MFHYIDIANCLRKGDTMAHSNFVFSDLLLTIVFRFGMMDVFDLAFDPKFGSCIQLVDRFATDTDATAVGRSNKVLCVGSS